MPNKGTLYAIGAYFLWGILPIYWKALKAVPPAEIMSHRMVWSLIFLALLLAIRKQWGWLPQALRTPKTVLTFLGTAALLALNWFTYIWAVNAGFIVETSLGYFINPLLSVLLGVLFLKERLRPWQWVSIGIAGVGVGYLTLRYGALPWIALTLASTFGIYGLLRKTARLDALNGLSLEMGFLFLPALTYLLYLEVSGEAAFAHLNPTTSVLLAFTGVVTALPLLLFAAGARRIPLSTIGILQYLAPSMQFLIGVYLYHEPFTPARLIGFSLIWIALLIYSLEGYLSRKKEAVPHPSTPSLQNLPGD